MADETGGTKVVLEEFPPGPSNYTERATVSATAGSVELWAVHEREGSLARSGLRFERVRAYRYRAEGHCTAWHSDGAYDRLVEVVPSDWVAELMTDQPSGYGWRWTIRHFLVYVDDAGAFEIAAADYAWQGANEPVE